MGKSFKEFFKNSNQPQENDGFIQKQMEKIQELPEDANANWWQKLNQKISHIGYWIALNYQYLAVLIAKIVFGAALLFIAIGLLYSAIHGDWGGFALIAICSIILMPLLVIARTFVFKIFYYLMLLFRYIFLNIYTLILTIALIVLLIVL